MNAYELASFLEADSWYKLVSRQEIVDMLRQQADQLDKVIPQLVKANGLIENLRIRIAELEKDLHIIERHYDQLNKDVSSKPVDIPHAWHCRWFDEDGDESWEQYEESHPATKHWDTFPDKIIPLYTHPVKQLSDEEIMEIATLMEINYGCVPPLEFAWAIIKEIIE